MQKVTKKLQNITHKKKKLKKKQIKKKTTIAEIPKIQFQNSKHKNKILTPPLPLQNNSHMFTFKFIFDNAQQHMC